MPSIHVRRRLPLCLVPSVVPCMMVLHMLFSLRVLVGLALLPQYTVFNIFIKHLRSKKLNSFDFFLSQCLGFASVQNCCLDDRAKLIFFSFYRELFSFQIMFILARAFEAIQIGTMTSLVDMRLLLLCSRDI